MRLSEKRLFTIPHQRVFFHKVRDWDGQKESLGGDERKARGRHWPEIRRELDKRGRASLQNRLKDMDRRADRFYLDKNYKRAAILYQEILDSSEKDLAYRFFHLVFWLNFGNALFFIDKLPEAIEIYKKGLECYPDNEALLTSVSHTFAAIGNEAEAEKYLGKVNPCHIETLQRRIKIYFLLANNKNIPPDFLKIKEIVLEALRKEGYSAAALEKLVEQFLRLYRYLDLSRLSMEISIGSMGDIPGYRKRIDSAVEDILRAFFKEHAISPFSSLFPNISE